MKTILISFIVIALLGGCDTNKNLSDNQEEMRDAESIDQRPGLPEADKPLPVTISLEAKDFVFLPPDIIVEPGKELLFVITNNGDHDHRIHFDLPAGDVELEALVSPGETDSIKITAPARAGEYAFYCPRENHREQAMEGRIIVKDKNDSENF